MKKITMSLLLGIASLNAIAQIDNLSNMSAEWMRTGARNAATDATDIVVYNPAGLSQMNNGLHINVGNQSLFRSPSHEYDMGMGAGVQKHQQDGSDPFLPNLYAAYKKDKWALFTGMFVSGGGATMNYSQGSITTDLIGMMAVMGSQGAYTEASEQSLKASSYYMTTTLGGMFTFSEKFSMAGAVRYLNATNKTEAGLTLTTSPIDYPDMPLVMNTEETANGMSAVLSMNIHPSEKFNFSMRYESQVKLDFETKQNKDDFGMTTDGSMHRRDLPAVFACGMAYAMNPKMKVFAETNYYFQQNADWGNSTMVTEEKPWSEMAGDAITYALALQYEMNDRFIVSCGGGFTDYMFKDKAGYYTNPGVFEVGHNDNCNLNMGMACKINEKFKVNAGYMHTFWDEQTIKALNAQPLDVDVKVNNSLNAIALGLEMTF